MEKISKTILHVMLVGNDHSRHDYEVKDYENRDKKCPTRSKKGFSPWRRQSDCWDDHFTRKWRHRSTPCTTRRNMEKRIDPWTIPTRHYCANLQETLQVHRQKLPSNFPDERGCKTTTTTGLQQNKRLHEKKKKANVTVFHLSTPTVFAKEEIECLHSGSWKRSQPRKI